MSFIRMLPHIQVTLNAISLLLITAAYLSVRSGRHEAHRRYMLAAVSTSTLFFVFYLIYHYHVGNIPFAGEGVARPIYFTILISHVLLAVLLVLLLPIVLWRILYQRDAERHRQIARWAFPVWLHVSVSGIVIYTMAFHLY